MSNRSRKETMSICGRSGIETLKSKLVRDGYFRNLYVLPDYFEPNQWKPTRRPIPELPPYNPQPLIDVYPQTINLGQISATPPYGVFSLGAFGFNFNSAETLESLEVLTETGIFSFSLAFEFTLDGIDFLTETYQYGLQSGTPYGNNEYGMGSYGGQALGTNAQFIIAFHNSTTATASSAAGNLTTSVGSGYGTNEYGSNTYG